jgi:hypothetical protein
MTIGATFFLVFFVNSCVIRDQQLVTTDTGWHKGHDLIFSLRFFATLREFFLLLSERFSFIQSRIAGSK